MRIQSCWITGDDFGRIISAALKTGSGIGEIIPAQGKELLDINEAGARFLAAYDPNIRVRRAPFALLRFAGLFDADIRALVSLDMYYDDLQEGEPDREVWRRFAEPVMDFKDYAAYVRETGDFPVK